MSVPVIDGAIEIEDAGKFADLPGSEQAIEIHYRITTPFQMDKGYGDMEDDDVKIRGPVYVGNQDVLDRHGELVEPDAILNAWEGYAKNPVILYNHSKNYGVIGRMDNVEMGSWEGVGDVVLGSAIIDGGEKDIVRKIRKGMLKAFSIGFIAKAAVKECKDEDECYIRFTEIDWIETSVVDIPASPNALFNVEKTVSRVGAYSKGESCDCGNACCTDEKEVVAKAVDLNRAAEEVAAKCIDQGDVVLEGSWDAPSAEAENAYLDENDWQMYGMWFLGRRADADPETKEHYAYPWSPNFKDCSRPGLNAIRSRAGQVGDEGVFNAAGRLRELLDDRQEGISIVRSGEKTEVGTDIYDSMEEAEARAEELGCSGSHDMEGPDGETLYMPCKTHDEYEATLGNPDLPMKNLHADSKSSLTASVMNPLDSPVNSMSDEITVESPQDEELPVEVKEAVATVEEAVVEVTNEVVTEEAEATDEESVAEEVVVKEQTADDVLVQVVSVLKSVEERMSALESIIDTTQALAEEVESLKAIVVETEAAKSVAEAEATIEAEVAKRVAEHLSSTPAEVKSSERKTLTTIPVDAARKNTLDPNPHVSEGMNGLAKWLENQISSR